jgi:hypothetical protein
LTRTQARAAVGALAFVVLLVCGAYLIGAGSSRIPQPLVVVKAVHELSELSTIRHSMSEVFRAESAAGGRLAKIFGSDRLLLVAHGEVTAGVNLKELKDGDVTVNGETVSVRLPPAKILGSRLVERQTYVVDRTTGMLIQFDKDLEREARLFALEHFVAAAKKEQIEKQAGERARLVIENLLKQLGFKTVTVSI